MLRTVLVYLLQRDLAFKKIIFQLCRFKLLFFFFFLFSRITVGVLSLFTSAHILETCFFFFFFLHLSVTRLSQSLSPPRYRGFPPRTNLLSIQPVESIACYFTRKLDCHVISACKYSRRSHSYYVLQTHTHTHSASTSSLTSSPTSSSGHIQRGIGRGAGGGGGGWLWFGAAMLQRIVGNGGEANESPPDGLLPGIATHL